MWYAKERHAPPLPDLPRAPAPAPTPAPKSANSTQATDESPSAALAPTPAPAAAVAEKDEAAAQNPQAQATEATTEVFKETAAAALSSAPPSDPLAVFVPAPVSSKEVKETEQEQVLTPVAAEPTPTSPPCATDPIVAAPPAAEIGRAADAEQATSFVVPAEENRAAASAAPAHKIPQERVDSEAPAPLNETPCSVPTVGEPADKTLQEEPSENPSSVTFAPSSPSTTPQRDCNSTQFFRLLSEYAAMAPNFVAAPDVARVIFLAMDHWRLFTSATVR